MDGYTHQGLRFDLDDLGPLSGEPVVALHGFPQDRSCWQALAPQLVGAGYRVLAPDQRGYSRGARPPGRAAYRLADLADDVLALADSAGLGSFHLVGHDLGALVAWRVAASASTRVASLTALSVPHPRAMAAALRRPDQAARSWYVLAFQVPGAERVVSAGRGRLLEAALRASGLGPGPARRYATRMADPDAARAALAWYRALPGLPPTPAVTVPTLQVWGRGDPFVGRRAVEGTAEWVVGRYRSVEIDGGHWLAEQHAEPVGEALLGHLAGSEVAGS